MPTINYYEILGVSSNASDREIRKAYHRLIKRFHPDHSPPSKDAARITLLLNEAYKICGNSESRRAYDYVLGLRSEELPAKKVAILSPGFCMNNLWKRFKRKQ
jgi:DnaJ-class molecular chaperone